MQKKDTDSIPGYPSLSSKLICVIHNVMMFATEESRLRSYLGTVTGISDSDPVKWKSSQWRNLQVEWHESAAGERPGRVSIWEIEPVATPFYVCPPPNTHLLASIPQDVKTLAEASQLVETTIFSFLSQ